MSNAQLRILTELAEYKPGMGTPLDASDRRSAGPLIIQGWVEWIQCGSLRVYIITEKGRAELESYASETPYEH